jgi:hypothetical protein
MLFTVRILLSLTLLFPFAAAWGTMVLPLNLSQMTRQAGKIFIGRCVDSSPELDEYGIPATFSRFEVLDGIKGVAAGETVLIKTFGTERGPLDVREGEKAIVPLKTIRLSPLRFLPDRDYLLFLYPESSLGFTSPVGAGQGRFEIFTDSQGSKLTVNPLGNKFLKNRGGPLPLDKMVEAVQKLVVHE